MPNALTIELSGTNFSYLIFWNTGSGGIDRLGGNVDIWNVNILRQKISQPKRDSNPPTFGFMPNALTIWAIGARHFLSHVLEHWLWWYRYRLNLIYSQRHPIARPHGCVHCVFLNEKWPQNCTVFWSRFWSHKEGNQSRGVFVATIQSSGSTLHDRLSHTWVQRQIKP